MNRPRVLIVFGVINLLFAAGWMFNGLSALVLLAMTPEFYVENNMMGIDTAPIMATYDALESPVFKTYWVANGILGILAGGLLGVAGVGLLMARPWGRKLSLLWASIAVLAVAVSVGMMTSYFVPAYASQLNEPLPTGAENILTAMASMLVRWAYPVVLMILLPRPNITAIFDEARQRRLARSQAQPAPAFSAAPQPMHTDAAGQPHVSQAGQAASQAQASTPHAVHQPTPAPEQRTWRDDPWNDPDVT